MLMEISGANNIIGNIPINNLALPSTPEVGVFKGYTTLSMALKLKEMGSNGKIIALDIPDRNFSKSILLIQSRILRGWATVLEESWSRSPQ